MPNCSAALTAAIALATPPALAIDLCSGGNRAERQVTCLVDGDTGWERGVKWRLKGVDTPEYAEHAECAREPAIAGQATERMRELMSGGYSIEREGEKGSFGRDLVKIRLADGRYAGDVLLEHGLAVRIWPELIVGSKRKAGISASFVRYVSRQNRRNGQEGQDESEAKAAWQSPSALVKKCASARRQT